MEEKKKTKYPLLARKNWWTLRSRFKDKVPTKVTDGYLSPVLKMTKRSARVNVIPELKLIGLIDDKGKPTELANRWRIDTEYSKVCEEIKKTIYPSELLDAVPDPVSDKKGAVGWFMAEAKVGEGTAGIMASFYIIVIQADPKGEEEVPKPREKKEKAKPPKKEKAKPPKKEKDEEKEDPSEEPDRERTAPSMPSFHFDFQIHVSPEATPEQIDKIFESIAKHFEKFYLLKKSK